MVWDPAAWERGWSMWARADNANLDADVLRTGIENGKGRVWVSEKGKMTRLMSVEKSLLD